MAMVVQHNLTAVNANRQLGVTAGSQAKSSEKLSSGYRINRAGDDAAGLKISEKMRSQIRGLNKASSNAQDGISLIQTAEGALNEAHSILQRMNELAVQGANDTNEGIDRDAINQELDQLTQELDRISTTTQFNKQNLLDGSFQSKNLQVGANADQKIQISIGNMDAKTLGLKSITKTISFDSQKGNKPTVIKYEGMSTSYKSAYATKAAALTAAIKSFGKKISTKYNSKSLYTKQFDKTTGSAFFVGLIDGKRYGTSASVIKADITHAISQMSAELRADFGKYVAVTATSAAKALSSYTVSGQQVSVDNYAVANDSITAIQEAINRISTQRSALGAIQNRLEHTVANLDNVSENTQSAESRIRDTDMASEMVEYSKNNILAQAGQSMLAQANQSTQGVLSLLQ
ncbi:MAG: flagellin [Lachnospiraceae bacterium]|nr:flagellin [Lachnospiraceae bacterium]